jgi:hypothetical protein
MSRQTGAFRSAGISPAIFPLSTHHKNAGETPALQLIACDLNTRDGGKL